MDIKYKTEDWKFWDSKADEWYDSWLDIHKKFKDSRDSYWMPLYELACERTARDFILVNCQERAIECLNAGIEINKAFLKKYNSKKHKKMTENELTRRKIIACCNIEHANWLLEKNNIKELEKTEIELFKFELENTTKKAVAKRERSKLIRAYIRYGYFEEARKLNEIQYTSKIIRKLKTEDIYTRDKFFYYLTEYLINPEENKANEPSIKDCFLYFFDETLKGNQNLYDYDEAGEYLFEEDMAYIWYKYFSDVPFEKIKPKDIVKCRRYGIIGIHCDKTE